MLAMTLALVGGLLSYPERTPGPELQQNGGFEKADSGWTARGYEIDTRESHSGRASIRLTDAHEIPRAQSVKQLVAGQAGPRFYRVTAWLKTRNLGANGARRGVRLSIRAKEGPGEKYCSRGCGSTEVFSGTHDWFKVELESVLLSDPSNGVVVGSDAYRDPSGSYWLDDVVLQEELAPPVEAVLRVPNYRGILWSDQPDIALFEVTANEPGAITAAVRSESGQSRLFPVRAGNARLDLRSVSGTTLTVTFRLDGRDAFPPFRLVRRPARERGAMSMTFSPDGRFLVKGKPTFLLGVYDSGLGYTNSETNWEKSFSEKRRLFELPGLNGYINYWFGNTRVSSMQAMMNVLSRRGIRYWQTANCFGTKRYGNKKGFLGTGPDPSYATTLGQHPGLGGWYLADECKPSLADEIHGDHLLIQQRDPDGVTLGAFNSTNVEPWLPSMDVIGVDDYPMYGAEPAGGYPFEKVYEGAVAVHRAGGAYRPFWQVIQYFKFTSKGRWPTRDELRSMSYAAIVGGADGLFYWSLGTNALAYVCKPASEWCPERVEYFERLKSVFDELSRLRALSAEDLPPSVVAVSDPNIKIRVKKSPSGPRFVVIAYNHSARGRTATFRLRGDRGLERLRGKRRGTVTVYASSDRVKTRAESSEFSHSFGPWGVHVYEVW